MNPMAHEVSVSKGTDKKVFDFIFESLFSSSVIKEKLPPILEKHNLEPEQINDERDFIHYLKNADTLAPEMLPKIIEFQKKKIKERIDPSKKTIAIYFPDCAYRAHVGKIAQKLRAKDYNALTFIGTICDDEYENDINFFYGGHGIVDEMDFVDLFICPTLTYGLPENSKKVLFVHDIHDSPLGDLGEHLRLIMHFDGLFLPSDYVVDSIKRIFDNPDTESSMEILKQKKKELCLISGGYIKLDRCLEYFREHKNSTNSIVYAPTITGLNFEGVVSLPKFGKDIVGTILKNFPNYTLIFRPHPHTYDTENVKKIVEMFKNNPKFVFDNNASFYMDNYSKASLMITDISGTAFTYAFTTLRPVLFFSHNEMEVKKQFSGIRYCEDRHIVGVVAENITDMIVKIKSLLKSKEEYKEKIRKYRDSTIYNVGTAEDYFVENIDYILEGKKHKDWMYL